MAFLARAAEFLADRVAPRLVIGPAPRNQPTRADLELQAEQELQARIDLGRPGAEEAVRRRPRPDWADPAPRRRPVQALDVVTVRLDLLGGAPAEDVAVTSRRARVRREARSG